MKKLLAIFFCLPFFVEPALAITLPAKNSNCKYNPSFFSPQLKETLTYDGKTYLIQQRFGNYYVNGDMLGIVFNKVYKNGILYVNDKPINQYNSAQTSNTLIKDSATTLFIQAYTKFSMKDYEGASDDCRKVLALDPNHRKATVLLTISDAVLSNKVTPAMAQTISDNGLDKIIKGAEGF
jgi:hypothetical protein